MYLIIICCEDYYENLDDIHWVKSKEELDRLVKHYLETSFLSIRVIQIEGDEPMRGWHRRGGGLTKSHPLEEVPVEDLFDWLPWEELPMGGHLVAWEESDELEGQDD